MWKDEHREREKERGKKRIREKKLSHSLFQNLVIDFYLVLIR